MVDRPVLNWNIPKPMRSDLHEKQKTDDMTFIRAISYYLITQQPCRENGFYGSMRQNRWIDKEIQAQRQNAPGCICFWLFWREYRPKTG